MPAKHARLKALDIERHGDGLYKAAIARDAKTRFEWPPETKPVSRQAFQAWLEMAGASEDLLYLAVIDLQADESIQKTPVATETFYLFGAYLFDDLGYRRFEWKCNDCNAPSKRAAPRHGMRAEGAHRQARVEQRENRDSAWFPCLITNGPPRAKPFVAGWMMKTLPRNRKTRAT